MPTYPEQISRKQHPVSGHHSSRGYDPGTPILSDPPLPTYGMLPLPRTRLHYVKAGSGPPLVIVPATVSLVEQWIPLVQFMGQHYTTFFFELPGHGESSPYPQRFDSCLVPATVAAFMDALGYDAFCLMGFSFGGLLAMRTLEALQDRIQQVILLSPYVTRQALKYSAQRQWVLRQVCSSLKSSTLQRALCGMMHSERVNRPLTYALSKACKINPAILGGKDTLNLPLSTLDVLAYTGDEIFTQEYDSPNKPFRQPCYFGMSIYDDLLDYDTTLAVVRRHFDDLTVRYFTLPYHQPPEQPTFSWLVEEFGHFLALLPTLG